ncbi:hypothetical protein Nepgr_012246 [Nepenthes gracilis]|uniref:Uncharacterized protein n=1 Tax=Nepenthes gracilis TaxID=150966 RepID=A0AAD3SGL4_NEPGR|nr:hypothetical protein Nepgr_012246 [Nepenthes gracilis]
MGGSRRQRTSFSILKIFKPKAPASNANAVAWDEPQPPSKVFPSDEDRGYWVAEPGIDKKASAFIAKFHEARLSESHAMPYSTTSS